jgi:glycosyltransferase involved in cell wall biosynthesis
MLTLYLLSLPLELLLFVPIIWHFRIWWSALLLAMIGFSVMGLALSSPNLVSISFVALSVFRIFNLLRIAKVRMHPDYLYHACRRTSLWLFFYHIILLAFAVPMSHLTVAQLRLIYGTLLLGVSFLIMCVTWLNIKKTRHISMIENYADKDLPTVTVAIPARNETPELEDCIRSVLANNYPKLEVIVLDDCSGDDTPEIIKKFAHDGVRFVPGSAPKKRWLAKNQAYEQLSQEASGDIILFCGVDVRFGPEAIRALVTTLLSRKKDMVSILPRRLTSNAWAAFVQPMRYWWELALPRRPFNRPPVLSTCWLIKKESLEKLGGFEAVSHTIIPEGYFARELVKSDGYSFIRADDLLDVQTRKNLQDQRETAIRMRYPQVRRKPEWVLFMTVMELLFLLAPFIFAASILWAGVTTLNTAAIISCSFLILTHVSIVQISNPANVLTAIFNFPAVVITEMTLGLVSMYRYEFATVEWKGRNICIPVMHIIPKLPPLSDDPSKA